METIWLGLSPKAIYSGHLYLTKVKLLIKDDSGEAIMYANTVGMLYSTDDGWPKE
jgi:hypothetical protein